MVEYVTPFDRIRIHYLWNYLVVVLPVRFLEDVKGSRVVDLNTDRVGNEGKNLRVVIIYQCPEQSQKV